MDPLDAAVGLRPPGDDASMLDTEFLECRSELSGELAAVIGHDRLECPASSRQVGRDTVRQCGGEPRLGVFDRAAMQLGPTPRRADVDGGVLPHRALGALEATDIEAVHLDQIARMVDLQVPFRRHRARLGGRRRAIPAIRPSRLDRVLSP